MRLLACFVLICAAFSIPVLAHPAWGMTVDDDKNVYFADIFHNNGTVWKLEADGRLFVLLRNFHAHNVNFGSDGNIYTAHGEGTHRLVRLSTDGKIIETLVSSRDETRFFGGNSAVSRDGTVYFGIRNHIWKYTMDGPVKFSDHRLVWNQATFVDNNGEIYVPDIGVGNGTLFKLGKDGTAVKIADDLISKLERPKDLHNDVLLGMAKDATGNFYIAETAGRRIVKINAKGDSATFYRAAHGWKPTAITFRDGAAYIHEYGRVGRGYDFRIVRVSGNGKQTELVKHSEYIKKNTASGRMNGWL